MVHNIRDDDTLLDYIDLLIEHTPNLNPVIALSLNKGEWIHVLTLIKMDYKEATKTVELSPEGNKALYRNTTLFYDGTDDSESDYVYNLREIRENRRRNLEYNLNPEGRDVGEEAPRGANRIRPAPLRTNIGDYYNTVPAYTPTPIMFNTTLTRG